MSEAALRAIAGYQAAARVVRRVPHEQARGVLALGRNLAEVVDSSSAPSRRARSPGRSTANATGWTRGARGARLLGNLERARARPLRRPDVVPRARQARQGAGEAGRASFARSRRRRRRDWVNGRAVGNRFGDARASMTLPPKLLKAGDNLVVVNVHDFWGNGGLHGPAERTRSAAGRRHARAIDGLGVQVAPTGLGGRRMRRGNRSPASTCSTTP